MDANFFRSFWGLLASQVKDVSTSDPDKLMVDLFSSTFLKALESASPDERSEFADAVEKSCDLIARTNESDHVYRINRACLLVLVGWIKGDISAEYDLINACIDSGLSVGDSIALLATQAIGKTVTNFLSAEGKLRLLQIIEQELVPRLDTQDDKIKLLSSCMFLSNDLENLLKELVDALSAWRRTGGDLDEILRKIIRNPRIQKLFRQLPGVGVLKERFLVTLAIALRASDVQPSPLVEEVKKAFFFVPSVGVVMDRWLDKELQKFNADVLRRVKGFGSVSELRDALASVFTEEWVTIPFGFEQAIIEFIKEKADSDSTFKELPCVMTAETVCDMLKMFPAWFEIIADSKARLTPAAMGRAVEPSVSVATSQPEDLVDILLKEVLSRLPQHAFLNRPYPSKVQPGVYRFGTREVTFHTKAGKLHVFRVGGYVSESDAVDFLAREFSVPQDKLRAIPQAFAAPVKRTILPPAASGMRRPMEWNNEKLLLRLVRRGLKAKDQMWRQNWESLCSMEGADYRSLSNCPKPVLQKFLEQNMAHAVRQDWARDLLYYDDKKTELGDGDSSGFEEDVFKGRPMGGISLPSPPPGTYIRPPVPPPEAHPNYKTRMCINFPIGRCTRGASCAYAHGEAELRAGPGGVVAAAPPSTHQYYKTRLCQAFVEGRCHRGVACNYAHSEAERQSFASQGVVKREARTSEDIRLAAKAEMSRERSRSRDRYRR